MTRIVIRGGLRAAVVSLAMLTLVLTGCKVEEEIHLRSDGSGTYKARVSVEEQFADVLDGLREKAREKGVDILEDDRADGQRYLVVGRSFQSLSELSDDSDHYAWVVERSGPWRATYRLRAELEGNLMMTGFDRVLKVTMPVPIRTASGGEVSGRTVRWDCSKGGVLEVEAAGVRLLGVGGPAMLGAVLVLAGLVALFLWLRRRSAKAHCQACGVPVVRSTRFCPKCGSGLQREER